SDQRAQVLAPDRLDPATQVFLADPAHGGLEGLLELLLGQLPLRREPPRRCLYVLRVTVQLALEHLADHVVGRVGAQLLRPALPPQRLAQKVLAARELAEVDRDVAQQRGRPQQRPNTAGLRDRRGPGAQILERRDEVERVNDQRQQEVELGRLRRRRAEG